jgi:murein L,D-transpeptidase YcbB/YkuD
MLLKVGSKGEEVKQLQTKLGLTSDGSFGPGTEKAVKEWQTKNGLTADGIIGDKSWAKMFGTTEEIKEVVTETLNLERLRGHIPDLVIDQIPETAKKFNITTIGLVAHNLNP